LKGYLYYTSPSLIVNRLDNGSAGHAKGRDGSPKASPKPGGGKPVMLPCHQGDPDG